MLLIAALGVAFYVGIRASGPDMELSADAFYDQAAAKAVVTHIVPVVLLQIFRSHRQKPTVSRFR